MENLSKYQAFVTAASLGNFTKTAEKLNYTQSAISRMISDLESEWHMSLLERRKTGVSLTSDGLKLLPYAKELCEKQKALQMQVDALSGLESGMVRIGTFSSVATHRLPEILKIFGESYPNIEFEILLGDYTEIEDWIAEGRVDFGFLRLSARPEFEAVFLEQDEFLVVLPENHFLAQKERVTVSELCTEPFILLEKGAKADIAGIFEKCGLAPRTRFTTWDDYAVMSMVEKGLGISILPELILKRVPYGIVTRSVDIPAYRSIGLVLRNRKTLSLAAKKFVEYIDLYYGQ